MSGPSRPGHRSAAPATSMFPATLDPVSVSTPFMALLEAAKRSDPEALDTLVRRFYPEVQRIVHHRLAKDMRQHRPWIAARFSTGDVVQQVFEGVLRDLGAFAGETEEAFVGYLAAVVRTRTRDSGTRARRPHRVRAPCFSARSPALRALRASKLRSAARSKRARARRARPAPDPRCARRSAHRPPDWRRAAAR